MAASAVSTSSRDASRRLTDAARAPVRVRDREQWQQALDERHRLCQSSAFYPWGDAE